MEYPEIGLQYLRMLTDSTGVIQHGVNATPNRKHGYTTDDNARALIAAVQEYERNGSVENLQPVSTYLSFMYHAHNPGYGFRNCMTYQRDFLDMNGTDDCLGRSLWACGCASSARIPETMRLTAKWLFDETFALVDNLRSPRAKAYALLGIRHYLSGNPTKSGFMERVAVMAESLHVGMTAHSDGSWQWFEPYLTYGNAVLPMGMMAAAEMLDSASYDKIAHRSLEFLTEALIVDGRLDLVGNAGWYLKGGQRAIYDQQTIDAGYTVMMYAQAYMRHREQYYADLAKTCYNWFFGENRSGLWVYDSETCGCYDAVIADGVNLNQGAESIACILMAQNSIREISV